MLHTILWHDNTANNRSNPDPRNWVGYGQRTIDEMAFSWVTWTYLDDEDYKTHARRTGQEPSHGRDEPGVAARSRCSRDVCEACRLAGAVAGRGVAALRSSSRLARPATAGVASRACIPTRCATRAARASSRCSRAGRSNPDGTIAMWFGYLNRNYEERLNIPVGADNGFNGEDMGQTEVFEPRRSRFAFKVDVPGELPEGPRPGLDAQGERRDAEGLRLAVAGVGSSTRTPSRPTAAAAPRSTSTSRRTPRRGWSIRRRRRPSRPASRWR